MHGQVHEQVHEQVHGQRIRLNTMYLCTKEIKKSYVTKVSFDSSSEASVAT